MHKWREKRRPGPGDNRLSNAQSSFYPQFEVSRSHLNALNFPDSLSCSLSDYKIQQILSLLVFFFFNFAQIFIYMSMVRMFFIIFPRPFPWISHILSKFSSLSNYQSDIICWLERNNSEKAMAPNSSTLAWKIPWTEEPGRLQSMGSLRVGHDWATSLWLFTFVH